MLLRYSLSYEDCRIFFMFVCLKQAFICTVTAAQCPAEGLWRRGSPGGRGPWCGAQAMGASLRSAADEGTPRTQPSKPRGLKDGARSAVPGSSGSLGPWGCSSADPGAAHLSSRPPVRLPHASRQVTRVAPEGLAWMFRTLAVLLDVSSSVPSCRLSEKAKFAERSRPC